MTPTLVPTKALFSQGTGGRVSHLPTARASWLGAAWQWGEGCRFEDVTYMPLQQHVSV